MPKLLAFDTETTGLPDWNAHDGAPTQPHCLELGWIFSPTGILDSPAMRGHLYLNHGEITIGAEAAAINGLTVEFLRDAGVGPQVVLNLFLQMARNADALLGHNVAFDLRIMRILAHQVGREQVFDEITKPKPLLCTKQMGRAFLGQGRWHLSDLHAHFFGEPHTGAHAALDDIEATWKCYHAMVARQQLQVEVPQP